MNEQQTLQEAATILLHQGHHVLSTAINGLATTWIPSSDMDSDSDDVPLYLLPKQKRSTPKHMSRVVLPVETAELVQLDKLFQIATSLVVTLSNLSLRVTTSDKTVLDIDVSCTFRLRETCDYFISSDWTGFDFDRQDLLWGDYGLSIEQWHEQRVIDGNDVNMYAEHFGRLTPVELQFLSRYRNDDRQTFIACLSILLRYKKLPQLEMSPRRSSSPRDCVSASFLPQTKAILTRLLGTRKLKMKRHVVKPSDPDDDVTTAPFVVLRSTW
jgi:hypothetical protein